jgi:proteasome lid subunit RPN8/RPN11
MIKDILAHAKAEYPKESCGLIVAKGNVTFYQPCRNIAEGNNHFILDPLDYASVDGEIRAIVHSHPDIPPTPSEADISACNQSNLPWWIASYPSGELVKLLPESKQSLIGREWDYPSWDCYRLVQDYYESKGIELPDFERGDFEWFRQGENKIEENLGYAGFKEVKLTEIQEGDGLLFAIGSKVANHVGIYYGNGLILHHSSNQLSRREPLNDSLLKRLVMVVRYNK